jgi:hypothetical protein
MNTQIAPRYLEVNFEPGDRLAVVALQRAANQVKQRLASMERIIQDDVQDWLHFLNQEKHEIYISMNALHEDAHGRKKTDVARIRHVYLDFDDHGSETMRRMMAHPGMPRPNHLIESSPGKWQAIWRVQDFEWQQAENLMRRMAHKFGADPAAVDSARVLRLPGFYNHKYDRPHLVTVEDLSSEVYRPAQFPQFMAGEAEAQAATPVARTRWSRKSQVGVITQSERDWAFARRALKRGEDPQEVIRAIAAFRSDKPNPQYYAEHTVQKARASMEPNRQAAEGAAPQAKTKESLSLGLW